MENLRVKNMKELDEMKREKSQEIIFSLLANSQKKFGKV